MIVKIADSINTILQSIMIICTINYCTYNKYKKNKIQELVYIGILFITMQITTKIMGNSSLSVILLHGILLIYGMIVFKKDSLGATIGFSIIYLFININLIICSNIFYGYIIPYMPNEYMEIGVLIFLYMPQYIMTYFVLVKREIVYKLYRTVKSKNLSTISLILITVIIDFINSFNLIIHDIDNPVFKEVIFILLGIFMVGLTIYFANIEKKSKEISILNAALEEKVNELKKVKHDYGAQISYLYGMHLMGKYDRLGKLLKDIIDGHNNITSDIKLINEDSIISMVVNSIDHRGINIIVDEQADLNETGISEVELQRVVHNILGNAITAIKSNGVINIQTYYGMNDAIIKIQNNGPKIEEDIIDKIFQLGFSTKDDKDNNHGFGLAIVKEIIESYYGKISVFSSEEFTEFVMRLPLKN